jgi:ankyrin repeat protein
MSRVLKYVLSALLFGLILTPAARADSNSDLYDAVVHNDVQKVKDLLSQGADPNSSWQNPGGEVWTALHIAARNDSAEIAALLLDKGADPNIRSRNRKQTPLMDAANNGSKEVALLLLNRGADPNAKDVDGSTVLLYAIDPDTILSEDRTATVEEYTAIVQALLAKGADPNAAKNGWTPLMYAAARNKPEIVKLLVKNGADVNVSAAGNSALSLAASDEIVAILKAAGAK